MDVMFVLCLLFCFLTRACSIVLDPRDIDAPFLACYDYIICGGGVSGLVLANRLTENPNEHVRLFNRWHSDNYEDFIIYPIKDGYGLGTSYDWNLWTAPQIFLDGAARPYDMGRGILADYDAWVSLGNPGWGWDDLFPYFKKSENYTDNVDSNFSRELYIQPNSSTHGSEGYVHVAYPRYFYNQSQLFLDGLQELGIPILADPNNGTAAGGMLIPDSLNPDNQTRSYARLDYFDTVIGTRQNLHVATHQHVTRVLEDAPHHVRSRDNASDLWISGVEFLTDGCLALHNVTCSREVILSAGAVHSPQILEFSGIGDPAILSNFDISVAINLPGVGNNFQDHPYVGVVYYCPWTAGAINTVAFPSLPSISQNWTNMVSDAKVQNTTQHLLLGLDATIINGYETQKAVLVDLLSRTDVRAYEILNDNIGLLAVATMHPFSRGSVHIQSNNPLLQPFIDPRYCSNPLDCQILVEALLFNNKLINTPSMKLGLRTEFHGTGTTSMLPLDLGGVVDTHLRVYGTINLRVVDAGIIPLVPAAHLQAPVYAIAEKAADIIKSDNLGLVPQVCGSNSAVAKQDPISPTSLSAGSNSISRPIASTFPELNTQVPSTTTQPSFASRAAEDLLPPARSELAAVDAVMDAAFMFATPSLFQISTSNISASGKSQPTSSASSILPTSTQSSIAPKLALPNSHDTNGLSHIDSSSISKMAQEASTSPTMVKRLQSPVAADITPSGHFTPDSGCTISFPLSWMPSASTNKESLERKISLVKPTSKRTSCQSRNAIHTEHTSTSMIDDGKTTIYTSTVTRLVTITVPARGVSKTNSY
ncbi:GMC oxidoreductase [Stipitochalara longipes BDJ]|nr:GMC oxidoreductase [Stipitochalara longipes BDJ]